MEMSVSRPACMQGNLGSGQRLRDTAETVIISGMCCYLRTDDARWQEGLEVHFIGGIGLGSFRCGIAGSPLNSALYI